MYKFGSVLTTQSGAILPVSTVKFWDVKISVSGAFNVYEVHAFINKGWSIPFSSHFCNSCARDTLKDLSVVLDGGDAKAFNFRDPCGICESCKKSGGSVNGF